MIEVAYSVVVPNLHSLMIGEVLDALRSQEGMDGEYEILVVGRDRYGIVRQQEAKDRRIRFLESERDLNAAEARNRGIKAAQGKVIFFIDADCIAAKNWMISLLEAYRKGYKVAGGPIWFDKGPFWILCDNVAHFHDLLPDIGRGINKHFMLPTANLLVERSLFEKVGIFDEGFPQGEDFEFAMRIRKAGNALFFEPDALVIHRPVRNNLKAVLDHSAGWARQSIRIRTTHRDILKTPWFLFQPVILWILSPFIASAVTAKIFLKHPCIRRYWYTAPVVFLTKLVWCWVAAREVAAGRHNGSGEGLTPD